MGASGFQICMPAGHVDIFFMLSCLDTSNSSTKNLLLLYLKIRPYIRPIPIRVTNFKIATYPDINLTLGQHWQWSPRSPAVCQCWPDVGKPTNHLKWLANGWQMVGQPTLYFQPNANVGSMVDMRP